MINRARRWKWAQQLSLLAKYGNICPDCGIKMRFDVYERNQTRNGGKLSDDTLTIDHIIPVSRGGKNTIDNFRLTCLKCNSKRGDGLIGKKTTNEVHKKTAYATYIGNTIILRNRYSLRVHVDNSVDK